MNAYELLTIFNTRNKNHLLINSNPVGKRSFGGSGSGGHGTEGCIKGKWGNISDKLKLKDDLELHNGIDYYDN